MYVPQPVKKGDLEECQLSLCVCMVAERARRAAFIQSGSDSWELAQDALWRRGLANRIGATGSVALQGTAQDGSFRPEPFRPTGLIGLLRRSIVIVGCLVFAVGTVFLWDMSQADGTTATPEMQQIGAMLQQIIQEQQAQRARIDELGQAVHGTGQAVQNTQTVTEQVVQQVVTQVQAGFAQEQQSNHEQLQQVAQANQQMAQAIQQIQDQVQQQGQNAVTASDLQQVGQVVQNIQGQVQQMQQNSVASGATAATSGVTATGAVNAAGASTIPVPLTPTMQQGLGGGIGAHFNIGGGASTAMPKASPAVAYAIQQGVVDGRSLGKPVTYDPSSAKVSFQDWSDSMITVCDSVMPGIYEVLERIVTEQPKVPLDATVLKTKFPHIDPLLIEYAESNVHAMLTTYTGGEARSLVRQAKRPNGAEAFRLLQVRFNPVTIGRQRAALIKITNPTAHVAIDKLSSEIVGWENKIVDYESRPGADKVSDAMKMAALVHMCPTKLQEHLQLNAGRFRSYLDLREEVFAYLDHVAPAASTTMDVGSLSKGCFNCGGPHLARDCPHPSQKGKGKGGKSMKGKGKDVGGGKKGKSKGGKDSGKDKSKGKGKSPCAVCG